MRAILFEDLDTSSPTFGALCIGTQGIQISKKRNETNTDWVWGTAINFQSINADYMITGILTDKNGKFYLNLDTGEFKMKDGTFVGNITGGSININDVFKVDKNGKVTISKDADISGRAVGGWQIDSGGLFKDGVKIENSGITNIYTWSDLYIIRLIIMDVIKPDSDMVSHYDFDNDGNITAMDYVLLKNRLKAL